MGLFGFFGKKPKKSETGIINFLNKADDAYVRAFQTKMIGNLDKYLTRTCCTKLMERIRMSDRECPGIERYKKTNWARGSDGSYVKTVTFEDVNMGHGIKVSMGDPYKEYWTVVSEDDSNKVSEIRRVKQC